MSTITTLYAASSEQVAYPVGENKDSYYMTNMYREDVETGEITVTHKVRKNVYSEDELLFEGTAKECLDYIHTIVSKIEAEVGKWVRDERMKQVLVKL